MPEESKPKKPAKGSKKRSNTQVYDGSKSVRVGFRLPRDYAPAFDQRRVNAGESDGDCAKRLITSVLTSFDQEPLRRELEELRSQVRNARMDLAKVAVMVLTRDQTRPYTSAEARAVVAEILSR